MTSKQAVRNRYIGDRLGRGRNRLETVDEKWTALYRYLYSLCADRLSPSDEADALLYNRDSVVRSWEQSQIAEFDGFSSRAQTAPKPC